MTYIKTKRPVTTSLLEVLKNSHILVGQFYRPPIKKLNVYVCTEQLEVPL